MNHTVEVSITGKCLVVNSYWFPERKNDLSDILVKIDSGNDCVPSGTKPLP